jgi:hypothetical protein
VIDAGLDSEIIDAVVFSQAPEAFFGISHLNDGLVDYVGATDVPSMRFHPSGVTGCSAAQAGAYTSPAAATTMFS